VNIRSTSKPINQIFNLVLDIFGISKKSKAKDHRQTKNTIN